MPWFRTSFARTVWWVVTPLALFLVTTLCGVVLFAPRRFALLALFAGVFFLSQRGGLQLGGLRLHAGRLLEFAVLFRVMYRHELRANQLGRLDKAVVLTYCFVTIVFILRTIINGASTEGAIATPTSKIGELFDFLALYFGFRGLVHSTEDVRIVLRDCVPLLVLVVVFLGIERLTFRNPLSVVGAASTVWIDDEDGGRIRCFGAFSHPSLLGTAGTWMTLLYVGLLLSSRDRIRGALGVALSISIVLFAKSGGPLTSLAVGLIGWACWTMRSKMQLVRRGIVVALIALALVMKRPIWFLPSKMSDIFGGGGWHRSYLMDRAIAHFGDWWLVGESASETSLWFPYKAVAGDSADITNLYVAFGIDGGLFAVILLIWLLTLAFQQVGKQLRQWAIVQGSKNQQLLVWALGCGVLMHAVNFISITYFDQTNVIWMFQIAAVAAAAGMAQTTSATALNEKTESVSRLALNIGAPSGAVSPRRRRMKRRSIQL